MMVSPFQSFLFEGTTRFFLWSSTLLTRRLWSLRAGISCASPKKKQLHAC